MLTNKIQKENFYLAEFFLVAISCIVLAVRPELAWLPLIIASLPWIIRLASPNSTFRPTFFDIFVVLFLVTTTIGLIAAYNLDLAFHKFYLIIGSILLLYSLAHQPKENLWIITVSFGVFGVITTTLFAFTNNWETFTADIGYANQLSKIFIQIQQFSKFERVLDPELFHPNFVGGINALLLPLNAASTIHYWKKNNKILGLFSSLVLLVLALGLFLTSSRAAWVATILGFGVFILLNYANIGKFLSENHYILPIIPIAIIAIGVVAPLILSEIFFESTVPIIEVTSFKSRLQLARQTYYLIADFPFTGGGLASFPGFFSQYILAIPFFMFGYSHNLYLDLALEQGIIGLIFWSFIIFLGARNLAKSIRMDREREQPKLLASAIYASLIIFLLHGILDDPIYSNAWGLPLLFVIPGYSLALSDRQMIIFRTTIKKYGQISLVTLAIISGVMILNYKPFFASWYANIGAIKMAKIELENWPRGEWASGDQSDTYLSVENYFHQSISYQELHPTSQYHLGLIAMSGLDFDLALDYLETAFDIFPEHRGIKKKSGL